MSCVIYSPGLMSGVSVTPPTMQCSEEEISRIVNAALGAYDLKITTQH